MSVSSTGIEKRAYDLANTKGLKVEDLENVSRSVLCAGRFCILRYQILEGNREVVEYLLRYRINLDVDYLDYCDCLDGHSHDSHCKSNIVYKAIFDCFRNY